MWVSVAPLLLGAEDPCLLWLSLTHTPTYAGCYWLSGTTELKTMNACITYPPHRSVTHLLDSMPGQTSRQTICSYFLARSLLPCLPWCPRTRSMSHACVCLSGLKLITDSEPYNYVCWRWWLVCLPPSLSSIYFSFSVARFTHNTPSGSTSGPQPLVTHSCGHTCTNPHA